MALVLVGMFAVACAGLVVNPEPDNALAPSVGLLARWWVVFLVLGTCVVFLMSLLYVRIRDSLHGAIGAPRSLWRVLGYGALVSLVLPSAAVALTLSVVPEVGEAAERMSAVQSVAISAVVYLFVPLFVVAYARHTTPDEIRHIEWASLDIGQ